MNKFTLSVDLVYWLKSLDQYGVRLKGCQHFPLYSLLKFGSPPQPFLPLMVLHQYNLYSNVLSLAAVNEVGWGHWAVYYTSPQSLIITFSY